MYQEFGTVSQITDEFVANFLKEDYESMEDNDKILLSTIINSAIGYMTSITGLSEDKLDEYPEFVIALLVLTQDMWDNGTYIVDKSNTNKTVDAILDAHRINLI